MPHVRAGEWLYDEGEVPPRLKDLEIKAENKPGHRPLSSYALPKWVYHPEQATARVIVEKQDYYGMAADGNRNYANWNVAHVAAYHDDLKLLSIATLEQCKEPNKWGMTPAHMCGMGQHPYGPSLAVLYELLQLGVVDPGARNHADQTPWHICQRMHKASNLKKFETVLLKGKKPEVYEGKREAQLRLRGKFARPSFTVEDLSQPLPVCLMFPGQGSQIMGMLTSLKDLRPVRDMLEQAKDILGYDILQVMLEGPEAKLAQTKFCQPAMYVAGLAAVEQLKLDDPDKVSRCTATAGLSLGEYTALTVAGVFDFETGLRLVKARAEAMEHETTKPGVESQAMLSVAGLEQSVVEDICKEVAQPTQTCSIANFLFPKGFSIAGSEAAVLAFERKANDAGALQAKVIKTSGAFHTPIMAGARVTLQKELDRVRASMRPPRCQVYMNATARPVGPGTPVQDIAALLCDQLVSPVLWEQSVLRALEDGCTQFYECGPNKQLVAMMKRIDTKKAAQWFNILA